ncbi:hypothetical protein NC653_035272 [Populus alba x Populus x berolinensis]|uniref:Uncharacterized protein n=1 Tax=Populus alba x Populus x berolinensis TaxID=444605 RepID=A0AAD6LPI9_9ROSI|nr:hypothetical protein NC653_035272 [Populus alba x Populus x berolinensis]
MATRAFTTDMVAAAPVLYYKNALDISKTVFQSIIFALLVFGHLDSGHYQSLGLNISTSPSSCSNWILIHFSFVPFILDFLKLKPEEVLIESTGVIGQRINKVWIIDSTVKKSLLSQLAMMLQFMCYEPCSFKDE